MALSRTNAPIGANNGTTAATTTVSIANFTVAGSEKVLYVLLGSAESTVTSPDPVVVWDSAGANETLTKIAASTGTGETAFLYRLIAPTDGTNKTISISGLSATARDAAVAVLYNGVDQTTPNDTIDVKEFTITASPSSATITNPAGDWIVSFSVRNGSIIPTVTGGGNSIIVTQAVAGPQAQLQIVEDTDGADDTIDYSSGGNAPWTLFTFNLNASGAAASVTKRASTALMLGVG